MFDAEPVWPVTTVGDVAEILDSRRVPLNADERRTRKGPYPYWGANGVVDHIDDYIFDEALVLMAEDGGNFADATTKPICHRLDGRVWVNNHAHVIRPTKVDRDFFYYWFVNRDITPFIKGGTRTKLNQADLKQLPISVPPLEEQQRIVRVLRSVDDAKASAESVADCLNGSLRALVDDFVRSADGETERLPIGQLAVFVGSGVTPKGGKEAYKSAGIPLIRSQNVHFDGLRRDGLAFIDPQTDAKMARTRIQAEDVLLNITGASIGRCTAVPADFGPGNVTQHVCIIRTDRSAMHPGFLAIFLSSHDGQRQIDQLQGGLSREGLNFQQVRAIEVPVPAVSAQAALVETVASMRAAAAVATAEVGQMQSFKIGLMDDLLSGRVRVPA